MKAIIDLKLYDTDMAELVHRGYKDGICGITVVCNDLYKTEIGNYFRHSITEFLGKISEGIVPQSTEETIKWLKDSDVLEKAIELFKDEIEVA